VVFQAEESAVRPAEGGLADQEGEMRGCVAGWTSRTRFLDNDLVLPIDSQPWGRQAYLTSFSISALIAWPQMS
jgi:hypothetical protein